MKVNVKNLSVNDTGMEFEIRTDGNEHLGDVYLTRKGLIWCRGKVARKNGETMTWANFIEIMEQDDDA